MHVRRAVVRLKRGAAPRPEFDDVVAEAPLRVAARGQVVATILRMPGHDVELVRGFLRAEGQPPAAITVVDGNRVDVDLPAAAFAPRAVASVGGCGMCGRDDIDDLIAAAAPVTSTMTVRLSMLLALPTTLRAAQPVFAATGGLHAAGLFTADGALLVAREDVGRHNAVDKVVGWGMASGIDLAACVLMLSGRLGFELAQKAAMAGIAVVASVSAPSSLALDVADRRGVTAIAFVRDDRATVYTHGHRVVG